MLSLPHRSYIGGSSSNLRARGIGECKRSRLFRPISAWIGLGVFAVVSMCFFGSEAAWAPPPPQPAGPPVDVTVVPGVRSLTVAWRPSLANLFSDIRNYQAVAEDRAGSTRKCSTSVFSVSDSCTISRLVSGKKYKVGVRTFYWLFPRNQPVLGHSSFSRPVFAVPN